MCGIAGFVGEGSEEILRTMTDALAYRGPDDAGYFFDGRVGLGHRRLSIIDVSPAGHQPMWDERGEVGVVFNGEMYNFRALRDELGQRGVKFASNSDTEVLLYAYRQWGTDAFEKFEGMCAAAIYDRRNNSVILLRDRFGKKPLYLGHWGANIIFASEPKAIFKHPASHKELNFDALNYFLQYECVPGATSIYKHVRKVLPSHYVLIKNGIIEGEYAYGTLTCDREITLHEHDAIGQFDALLDAAVSKRLMSDVPLGVFLSGGIDSSTVAYYAQKNSSTPIKTFSIAFDEVAYDESSYARAVAKRLGTEHHEETLTASHALELLPALYAQIDEPFADASLIPTYFLSEITRKHVTIALGGDGGDETLLGYQTFRAHQFGRWFRRMPKSVLHGLEKLAHAMPVSDAYFSAGFKAQHFFKGFEYDSFRQDVIWRGSFGPGERAQLLSPEVHAQLSDQEGFKPVYDVVSSCADASFENTLSYLYLRQYLVDDILVKVDRASMLHSLEVRAPFLDHDLVDFVLSLPPHLRRRGGMGKWILKKVMAGRLPTEVIDRPKKGFAVPVARWLRAELRSECERVFDRGFLTSQGLFNEECVQKMWQAHASGKKDFRKELWTLLSFQWWFEHWMLH